MGSPGADGNALRKPMPPTEYVGGNLRAVEELILRGCLKQPRTWEEVFRDMLTDMYPRSSPKQLDRMIGESLRRKDNGYLPVHLMNKVRTEQAFHNGAALK